VRPRHHTERHRIKRAGWLRAAVLGANDGVVSTASLVLGVAAASSSRAGILVAGVAGLVAGALSLWALFELRNPDPALFERNLELTFAPQE